MSVSTRNSTYVCNETRLQMHNLGGRDEALLSATRCRISSSTDCRQPAPTAPVGDKVSHLMCRQNIYTCPPRWIPCLPW